MAAQSIPPVVLLTRPQLQSARFAEVLRARVPNASIFLSPLMGTRFIWPAFPDKPWRAMIFTSETAAEMAGTMKEAGVARFPDKAFCVGPRTAQAAKTAGFAPLSACANADALLTQILAAPIAPLLHLRGREVRGDLAKRLSVSGVATTDAIVYAQEKQPLTAQAVALLRGHQPILIPLFSPRSAGILQAECLRIGHQAPLTLAAISAAVAEAATGLSSDIEISAAPDGESVLEAVVKRLEGGQTA